ncbi:hypothetical protein HYALB_00011776 [Hymenoscyphus albidus]|uniref:Amidoligase enzyme-domain-containing protein n=1 Tax=Hymenoscyphus albidus TaxID=595503 RepID=A0A9N9Q756_9HELO|nr:hypothetical protein HYALB_00011776 [Hymenoscyphus albidus]
MVVMEEDWRSISSHSSEGKPSGPPGANRLTFGVELGLLIACRPSPGAPDPDSDDPRSIDGIVEARQYRGNDWEDRQGQVQKNVGKFLKSAGLMNVNDGQKNPKMQDWIVKDDISLNADAAGYDFMQVEIVSPPFYSSKEAVSQVGAVCDLLTSKYRIVCNETTGLHCHVGYGNHGFSPRVLSNIFATSWTFYPLLDSLHPSRRRGDHPQKEKSYSPSIKNFSHLAVDVQDLPDRNMAGLKTILETRGNVGPQEILHLMQPAVAGYGRLAYNISNIAAWFDFTLAAAFGNPRIKKTIEFRQHEGTLASRRIKSWINVCQGLVRFAERVDDAALDKFLLRHINDNQDTDYTAIDLLKAIALPDEAAFYKQWFQEHPGWLDPPSPASESEPSGADDYVEAFPLTPEALRDLGYNAKSESDSPEKPVFKIMKDIDETESGPSGPSGPPRRQGIRVLDWDTESNPEPSKSPPKSKPLEDSHVPVLVRGVDWDTESNPEPSKSPSKSEPSEGSPVPVLVRGVDWDTESNPEPSEGEEVSNPDTESNSDTSGDPPTSRQVDDDDLLDFVN